MNKSKIEVEIQHDGEYCGECQFLRDRNNKFWCAECDNESLWTRDYKVKRCDECVRRAVPIEEKQEEK